MTTTHTGPGCVSRGQTANRLVAASARLEACSACATCHAEARCYLFRFCEPLIAFRKIRGKSQDSQFAWKNHWKQLGWACKLDGVRSQNHQGRVTSISQVNVHSDMAAACVCMQGRGGIKN
uniref:Uncharacterized protein n=1 Tax=Rousettus aegyptiacus TaxID=9407 RepID=A0A7J8EJV4_ROUAE|nr:hypothetical protein HJG63_012505 [Rousettus aegyptiacus]